MRSTSGQATIDYVAIIAVLGIVLGLALGVASAGAAGVVNAVTGQIRHALCLVGGGPCTDPRSEPCIVARTRDLRHVAVNLLVVRLDYDRYMLSEQMSDGTVRLTVARGGALGAEVAAGATARMSAGGRPVGMTDELRAAAQGSLGSGKVYVARDEREAGTFTRAIRDGRAPAPPSEVFYDGGVRGLARAGIGSGWLEGLSGATIGVRRDRRTGEQTVMLNAGAWGWGAVSTVLGGPAGLADRATTLGLTLDRRGRPRELSLLAGGTIAAGVALPLALKRVVRRARGAAVLGTVGGRRWELAVRLDLRDRRVQATWARFRRAPTSPAALAALGETIRDGAHLDVRAYRTGSTLRGAEVGVAAGVRVGAQYDHIVDEARLLGASSRPPGGLWERRLDCVAA